MPLGRVPDLFLTMALVLLLGWLMVLFMYVVAPAAERREWRDCHHNARWELVCRTCWSEVGRWRCTAPRIVRTG